MVLREGLGYALIAAATVLTVLAAASPAQAQLVQPNGQCGTATPPCVCPPGDCENGPRTVCIPCHCTATGTCM